MQSIKKLQLTFVLLIFVPQTWSQEAGRTFIRNYPPLEYRASQQNWAIAQDRRGIMYYGNNDGLLEFDGVNWRLMKLPVVRSIAVDSVGRIFVGLENDFGFLQPDNTGNFQYHSLKEKIPEIHRDLSATFFLLTLGDKVIFQTNEKLFVYQNEQIKVLVPEGGFHHMYIVHNRLFVREPGKGLFYLDEDSLRFVEGSERLAEDKIYAMMPFGPKETLIITRTQGVLVYAPENQTKFLKPEGFNEVDNFFLKNPVYCGTVLANGDFATGTLTGGLLVFNAEGKIKNLYNRNTGLQDNTILYLYYDQYQQLWTALDNGISLIQNNLPFQSFAEPNGLNGSPLCLKYFNNRLYVGTSQYLHVQNSQGNFETIAGTESQNFNLYEANNSLLLAGTPRIFEIKGNKAIPLANTNSISASVFCPLKNCPEYLLAGADDGLYLLEYKNSSWKLKNRIKGFNKPAYLVDEDDKGNIWISSNVDLFRARVNPGLDSVIVWQQYTSRQGLPSNFAYPVTLNSGEVVFGTEKGIYRYLSEKDRFVPHPDFLMLTGKVIPFMQEKNGDIWFDELLQNGNHKKGVLKLSGGKYVPYTTPFYKFTDIGCNESQFNICSAPDSSIFFGTNSGLLQYNPLLEVNYDLPFNTLIRKVLAVDSLLFGGNKLDFTDFLHIKGCEIPYLQNDMTLHFAATFYEDSEKTLYSYRLTGSDTSWSSWVKDNKKEYTNLPEGKYSFEVKSKNQYQKTGSTASYSFVILPPWYHTWWAYGICVVLAALLIWLIVKLNIQRLVKQKEHLENIVTERTAEVVKQKKEIQVKNEELETSLDLVNSQKMQIQTAHEEITASINYAKYIQSSVLPKAEQLESCLGEYFILHKPKEIVSGDFYWVSQTGNKTIIAAADCTGHGVPGAFMSMLGIALLNEIVNKESVTNPGIILDHLRKEVTASLKQKGERWEQKDGMDIALCTIDRENMKLQFAGAINPLYLIRSSTLVDLGLLNNVSTVDDMIIEIRGDSMPIGITDEMDNFACHEIDMLKGDSYYLFTDGFPDQFGGTGHKKFSHKQFRELLLKTKTKTMHDQRLMLDKVLYEWMGTGSQTDDILVIGFRIN